ncbi:uncharacterized protein LOC124312970 [Daphnia pulicaria]|uniref:uncharacterized protein LOC124312970 n=1 Tax=Daphnia pulicaria TaxID=35523 RepID=UPI001EECE0A6|nr:uncharacterized protein LOC124312970 [Daphnia pulicaria]
MVTMGHSISWMNIVVLSLLAGKAACACVGTSKTFTSMKDTFVLANPEKGFYHGYEIFFSNYQAISLSTLQQWRTSENVTLVHINYVLDNFVTSNISSTILSKLTVDFQTLRSAGMKAIVRFSYTLTEGNMNDAALTQLIKHIDQLKPYLQANSDVIATVQAGFIGTWGEWYYSNNYATPMSGGAWYEPTATQQTSRNTILSALMKAVPTSRMVQLRTPTYKQKFCGTANLSPSQAFNASNMCARIGIHNDCFMASSQDQGTFESDAQRTWLTNEGRYVIVGGESCESNSLTGCTGGVNQINKQRFSYLNVEYHPTVINGWKTAGCYNQIANLMGYRFELINGTFPSLVTRGQTYCATVSIKNTGVAPIYNPRPVQVILRNKVNLALTTFAQTANPRSWSPGLLVSVGLSFTVPSAQSVGSYDVILNLLDASSSISSNPNYRILFANANGIQETSTRFNILGQLTVQ